MDAKYYFRVMELKKRVAYSKVKERLKKGVSY